PRRSTTLLRALLIFLLANASYLAAFDLATIFYHAQVVLHVVLGLLLVLLLVARGRVALLRLWSRSGQAAARAWLWVVAAASVVAIASSLVLAVTGTATPYRPILATHVIAALGALVAGVAWQAGRGRRVGGRRVAGVLEAAADLPSGVHA